MTLVCPCLHAIGSIFTENDFPAMVQPSDIALLEKHAGGLEKQRRDNPTPLHRANALPLAGIDHRQGELNEGDLTDDFRGQQSTEHLLS